MDDGTIDILLSSLTNQKNNFQAENDAIGQELQKQLEAAGKIFYFLQIENYDKR